MHEIHFGVRGMKRAAMHAAAGRPADHHGHRRTPQIVRFRDEVGDLIEAAGDEIDELHFGDRAQAEKAHAAGGADDGGFGDGRFDHAFAAEFGQQAVGDFESSAVDADVFADGDDRRRSRSISSIMAWRIASTMVISPGLADSRWWP